MTATYTADVFCTVDGFGAPKPGTWGGYWNKQGPELLDHRLALYSDPQRMVFGANTYRQFAQMLAGSTEDSEVRDPLVTAMWKTPATVVSSTLKGPLNWPDFLLITGLEPSRSAIRDLLSKPVRPISGILISKP